MDCPNCGTPEEVGSYTCPHCGVKYASEDLIQYHRLEFLLNETKGWQNVATQRAPYQKRFDDLKAHILPQRQAEPAPEPIQPTLVESQPIASVAAKTKVEAIPFDQWLLSERNIKLALYSGGVLLLLAGIIFVGINWDRFSGVIKVVITLIVTLLLYGGGVLLFRRPLLKLGGIALLAIASGFVPLDFVVLQTYITHAWGVSDNAMWLAASIISLGIYAFTAFRTRGQLFTYIALVAFASLITAGMTLMHLVPLVFLVGYSLAAAVLLIFARAIRSASFADFTRLPLLIVTQSAAPVLLLVSAIEWVRVTNCLACTEGSPYLALGAMFIGVAFYIATDALFSARAARWAAALFFALSVVFALTELHFSAIQTGIALKVLALAYLGLGLILERRERKRTAGLPLYAAGYLLAAFVTFQSLLALPRGQADLALALIADTVILALSAPMHRNYTWIYGATWLFMAPVFIYLRLGFPGIVEQGLGLSALMVLYVAAGYALGRRALKWGGPFLTAAAFLSAFVWLMLASNVTVTTFVLILIAILYLLVSLWLKWEWLLPIALGWVDLCSIFALMISLPVADTFFRALTVVYAAVSIVLVATAYLLVRFNFKRWRLPIYLVALGNFGLAYLVGLYFRGT